jgi:hypothetical protein
MISRSAKSESGAAVIDPATRGLATGGTRRAVLAASLGLPLALWGCSGDHALKYRLTVTLKVDGRRVRGSSVRRLSFHQGRRYAQGLDVDRWTTEGDAAVVDLGERGVLFATLAARRFDPTQGIWSVGGDPWMPLAPFFRAYGAYGPTWRRSSSSAVVLTPAEYPALVTFSDRSRADSIREVDPADLRASFGPGVELESISAQVTHDRVTRGVVQGALPWLSGLVPYKAISGKLTGSSRRLVDNINPDHFSW